MNRVTVTHSTRNVRMMCERDTVMSESVTHRHWSTHNWSKQRRRDAREGWRDREIRRHAGWERASLGASAPLALPHVRAGAPSLDHLVAQMQCLRPRRVMPCLCPRRESAPVVQNAVNIPLSLRTATVQVNLLVAQREGRRLKGRCPRRRASEGLSRSQSRLQPVPPESSTQRQRWWWRQPARRQRRRTRGPGGGERLAAFDQRAAEKARRRTGRHSRASCRCPRAAQLAAAASRSAGPLLGLAELSPPCRPHRPWYGGYPPCCSAPSPPSRQPPSHTLRLLVRLPVCQPVPGSVSRQASGPSRSLPPRQCRARTPRDSPLVDRGAHLGGACLV